MSDEEEPVRLCVEEQTCAGVVVLVAVMRDAGVVVLVVMMREK